MKAFLHSLHRFRYFLFYGGGIVLIFLGICAFLRISNLSDALSYLGMVKNYVPMTKDFAFRRFNEGDSMSALLRRYPTNSVGESVYQIGPFALFGDIHFVDSENNTGFGVYARDGKMFYAAASGSVNGVPWDFTFFETTNADQLLDEMGDDYSKLIARYSSQKTFKP